VSAGEGSSCAERNPTNPAGYCNNCAMKAAADVLKSDYEGTNKWT
jgi:hypothetical protein